MSYSGLRFYTSFFLVLFSFVACQSPSQPDLEAEKAAILKEHEAQRDFHFNKKIKEFAAQLTNDFTSVNRGIISKPTRAENEARYRGYFGSVEFVKWDDVREPEIRFSNDASLAYVIVEKDITVKYQNDKGEEETSKTLFAWISIFRKIEGEWKIEAVASTNQPEVILEPG